MGFLKNIFGGKKEQAIASYADLWDWFRKHEKGFYATLKSGNDVDEHFLEKVLPKLKQLNEGFWLLAGMYDDTVAELVITAEGEVSNFVLVEECVAAAPQLPGWRFTALKPALSIENVNIEMAGETFNSHNMSFYANPESEYPDEIELYIVHNDQTEDNKAKITQGCYIYLDNLLGELHFASLIDSMTVIPPAEAKAELIPMSKLHEFLNWRQNEFVEKYEGVRHDTENDNYVMYEATTNGGLNLVAPMNKDLLEWDAKASHPWMMIVSVKYDGAKSNGMPSQKTYELCNALEEEIEAVLKDADGYLNIGRQTGDNERLTYMACKEFRRPSKLLHELTKKYAGRLDLSFDIYKDKYWRSLKGMTGS